MSQDEVVYCLSQRDFQQVSLPANCSCPHSSNTRIKILTTCISVAWLTAAVCMTRGLIPVTLSAFHCIAWFFSIAGTGLMLIPAARGVGDRAVQVGVAVLVASNGIYWLFASQGTFGTSALGTFYALGFGIIPVIAFSLIMIRAFSRGSSLISLGTTGLLAGLSMGNISVLVLASAAV